MVGVQNSYIPSRVNIDFCSLVEDSYNRGCLLVAETTFIITNMLVLDEKR